ncbi:hypothetical protein CLCOS_12780 [Clostridium coskatii]|uniref:Uncharacterized protein n=1 Tax=Clostridium coskatii TaxID=1705578 RepID=A0A166SXD4_9CLOT|nr:hypothetical protein WX73_00572 [Clostridium coskatii]OBR95845.1 hypothetical protein CLCOS_12780 [Clostridium coskatii]
MHEFLINQFGKNLGNKIYSMQQKKIQTIIGLAIEKSNNQLKTLEKTTILIN